MRGVTIRASARPTILGIPRASIPEEAFVASLSSCHMLSFLAIASQKAVRGGRYHDDAVGILDKDAAGRLAITKVTLRPDVQFSGDKLPTPEEMAHMHDRLITPVSSPTP